MAPDNQHCSLLRLALSLGHRPTGAGPFPPVDPKKLLAQFWITA